MICWPREISAAVREGMGLCYNVIIPSLFPFFILTSLVISLGLAGYLGRLLEPVMRPLFRVGGVCAAPLALGFIGGYPVGARAALTLYENGQCTKTEAERLLAFCNNSGPAFILGVVGAGVFADSRVGLLLCLIHATASLCVGLVFRFYRPRETESRGQRASSPIAAKRFTTAFTDAVKGAVTSSLNICAFVVLFRVLAALAPAGLAAMGLGMLEMVTGIAALEPGRAGFIAAAAIVGWGGLSVHCQALSAAEGLSFRWHWAGKAAQGLLSAALAAGVYGFL